MLHHPAATRRHFTRAALDAALAKRRELAALPKAPLGTLNLFVTRGCRHGNDYGWEIRRFGAIVVARSDSGYATPDGARGAGALALKTLADG